MDAWNRQPSLRGNVRRPWASSILLDWPRMATWRPSSAAGRLSWRTARKTQIHRKGRGFWGNEKMTEQKHPRCFWAKSYFRNLVSRFRRIFDKNKNLQFTKRQDKNGQNISTLISIDWFTLYILCAFLLACEVLAVLAGDNSQRCIESKITNVIQVQRENHKQQAKQASKQSNTWKSCQALLQERAQLFSRYVWPIFICIYTYIHVHMYTAVGTMALFIYVPTYVLHLTVCLRVLVLHFFEKSVVHVYNYNIYIYTIYADAYENYIQIFSSLPCQYVNINPCPHTLLGHHMCSSKKLHQAI